MTKQEYIHRKCRKQRQKMWLVGMLKKFLQMETCNYLRLVLAARVLCVNKKQAIHMLNGIERVKKPVPKGVAK